ncbi:MAG: HEAT repeat domain-containing protein [Limisphaerales bacterium]
MIKEPLASVGTNAIPGFVDILHRRPDPAWIYSIKEHIWKVIPQRWQVRLYRWRPVPDAQMKRTALFGLRFLAGEARIALPEVIHFGLGETNPMVRAGALVAALNIAPESPESFAFWLRDWQTTNYFARRDLAIYLRAARFPIRAAAPYLLQEAKKTGDVTVLEAFEYLGEAARPAVPYMVQVFREGRYRLNLLPLFKRLGPLASDAAPVLVASLANDKPEMVARPLEVLASIGSEARLALPAIRPLLTNSDPTIQMLAAAAQARIEGRADVATSVLVAGLEGKLPGVSRAYLDVDIREEMPGLGTHGREAAAMLLGELGPAARAALPALESHLSDPNQSVRLASAQALWRITGDATKPLPVLTAMLDSIPKPAQVEVGLGFSGDHQLIRLIEALGEMGPAARSAIPALKRVRCFSMAARHAVNAALTRINAPAP